MARQTGKVLFLGTRYGCTGYILGGQAYIRRRSCLDGKRWKRDAAFARTRAAAGVFGQAARFTARIWRGIPREMKRLMDGGAFNRLMNAVREAHVSSASEVIWRSDAKGRPACPERVVSTFSLAALGGSLNGLDLSEGQLLADGIELMVRDRKGGFHCGLGHLLHVRGVTRIGFDFESEKLKVNSEKSWWGDAEALRVRVWVSNIPETGRANASHSRGEWVVLEPDMGPVMVDLPTDAEEGLRFVGLEVAVKRKGRWKRLSSACKVFVLENCVRFGSACRNQSSECRVQSCKSAVVDSELCGLDVERGECRVQSSEGAGNCMTDWMNAERGLEEKPCEDSIVGISGGYLENLRMRAGP